MEDAMSKRMTQRSRPTLEEIRHVLRAHLPDLRERYGVTSLGIFGSYVRDEQCQRSDLDLLVEFDERPLTLLQFIALENELSDRLGVKVDLVEKCTLKPAIGRHILQEVVML
jgi:predicted nucleotidyltransferase